MNKRITKMVEIIPDVIMLLIITIIWVGGNQILGTSKVKEFVKEVHTIEHSFLIGYDKMYCVTFVENHPNIDSVYIKSIVKEETQNGYEFKYAIGLWEDFDNNEIAIHATDIKEAIELKDMYKEGYTKFFT